MRRYLAEAFGTFLLVLCGTGAIVINEASDGAVTQVGIACAFGLAVAAVVMLLGPVSGAHINPAATLALWAARLVGGRLVVPYIIAQVIGALAASLLLRLLFPSSLLLGATVPNGPAWHSFGLEVLLAFVLFLVVLLLVKRHHPPRTVGAAAGAVVLLEALFAGPISGASMNPARSIGPAVVAGHYADLWVYLFAPIIGALSAVQAATLLQPAKREKA